MRVHGAAGYAKGELRIRAAGGPRETRSIPLAAVSRRRITFAVLLACALVAGGCGGDDGDDGAAKPPPEARPEQFPAATGKTLVELRGRAAGGRAPCSRPRSRSSRPDENRLGFGLFTASRAQIADAATAVYVAPAGGGEAEGPYVARYESLEVKPQFQSQSSASDPDAAKSVYVADVPFDKPGKYELLGIARLDDRLVAATSALPEIVVSPKDTVPAVGDKAPLIHTPTEADAAGDIESIDTRVPPSTHA